MYNYSLNVSIKSGTDWTGVTPKFVFFCLVELGTMDKEMAMEKANMIINAMGREDYKFMLRATPVESCISTVL